MIFFPTYIAAFWLIINKPQPNFYSGDTFFGHEGVLWIEAPLYLHAFSLGRWTEFLTGVFDILAGSSASVWIP